MAISVVQTSLTVTGDNVASLESATTDWTSNIGSGNSILIIAYGFDNDATGLTFNSISWSAGGSFTQATTQLISNGNDRYRVACWYLHNAAGSGTKPTATLTPSQAAFMNFAMLEVSGLADAAEETENTNSSGTSTTAPTAGAITTTTADTIILHGYVGLDGNPQNHTAPGSPAAWTEFAEQTDNTNHQGGSAAYIVVSSTQTDLNPAWTTTNSRFAMTVTAFKIAAAGAAGVAHIVTTGGWVF